MGEVWAAVTGLVIGVAGTAYSIYSQQSAIDAANSVKFPKTKTVNIAAEGQTAFNQDKTAYGLADADWLKRFPELAAGRDYIAQTLGAQIANPAASLNPDLASAGLRTLQPGTNAQESLGIGMPVLGLEQRGRTTFSDTFSQPIFSQRQFGLNSSDAERLAIANAHATQVGAQNTSLFQLGQYSANVNNQDQLFSGALGGLTGLAGIGSSLYNNYQLSQVLNRDPSLGVQYYNYPNDYRQEMGFNSGPPGQT